MENNQTAQLLKNPSIHTEFIIEKLINILNSH